MFATGSKLRIGLVGGLRAGWHSFVWMCRIVVPISLLVAFLQWSGWLEMIYPLLAPLMTLLDLPPEAALPIVSGMLVNIYAVLGMLAVLPFTVAQMTLIAVFSLIAHNLITEGIIEHRSGMNVVKATIVRVGAAMLTVLIVGAFLGDTSASVAPVAEASIQTGFADMLIDWAGETGVVLLKILGIVVLIMVVLEVSRAVGWMDKLVIALRPLTKVFGLAEGTTTMFVAGIVFGLLYGGAVIVEEAKKQGTETGLARTDIEYLHISLGINHSMIEDPALFVVLGLHPFWLWVPRLAMAVVVVQSYRGLRHLLRRLASFCAV